MYSAQTTVNNVNIKAKHNLYYLGYNGHLTKKKLSFKVIKS